MKDYLLVGGTIAAMRSHVSDLGGKECLLVLLLYFIGTRERMPGLEPLIESRRSTFGRGPGRRRFAHRAGMIYNGLITVRTDYRREEIPVAD